MSIDTHVRKRINQFLSERDARGLWLYEVTRYYGPDGRETHRELKHLSEMTDEDFEALGREYRMRGESLMAEAASLTNYQKHRGRKD